MMDEAHKKAQATRERTNAARAQRYEEQAASIRTALQRVVESETATPAEILEAARLLVEIGK